MHIMPTTSASSLSGKESIELYGKQIVLNLFGSLKDIFAATFWALEEGSLLQMCEDFLMSVEDTSEPLLCSFAEYVGRLGQQNVRPFLEDLAYFEYKLDELKLVEEKKVVLESQLKKKLAQPGFSLKLVPHFVQFSPYCIRDIWRLRDTEHFVESIHLPQIIFCQKKDNKIEPELIQREQAILLRTIGEESSLSEIMDILVVDENFTKNQVQEAFAWLQSKQLLVE